MTSPAMWLLWSPASLFVIEKKSDLDISKSHTYIHTYIECRKMPSIFRTIHWIIPETSTICIHKLFQFYNKKTLKNSSHRFKSELKLSNTGLCCQIRILVVLYYYNNFNNKRYRLVTFQLKLPATLCLTTRPSCLHTTILENHDWMTGQKTIQENQCWKYLYFV